MDQVRIKGLIITDPMEKNSNYQISSTWHLPHCIPFCSFFAQHRSLIQVMLTPVDTWSNIHGVWV